MIPIPGRLSWRIALAIMATTSVVMVVIGISTHDRIERFHLRETQHSLERMTPLLSVRYAKSIDEADIDTLRALVQEDHAETDIRITVIAPDGTVLAESSFDPDDMENHIGRPEVQRAVESGQGSAVRFSDTLDLSMMYVARTIPASSAGDPSSDIIGFVRAGLPLSVINAEFEQVRDILIASWAALMIAICFVTIVTSTVFSRGIGALAHGARQFADGNLDHRISTAGTTELRELGSALNDMARRIGDQVEDLEKKRQQESVILQSMSSGMIALGPDQHILTVNSAASRILGIDAAGSRGRLLHEVVRHPEIHTFVEQVASGSPAPRLELTLAGTDARTVRISSETMVASEGNRAGLLLILDDVTHVRRLESLRSDFAANVSHELRTPITNVKGYIETLFEVGLDDREQAERFLTIVHKNVGRLQAIVEDIMSLTNLEQPRADAQLTPETLALRVVVADSVSQLQPAADKKSIRLTIDVSPDLIVSIYSHLVGQAVTNLVSNAIRYSPASTEVRIRAYRPADQDGTTVIEVKDQGVGIAPEHLPRLFERFYRVDKARSREVGGTGLGLAIVKHIALVHQGSTEVESTVGEGSVFRIILRDR